MHDVVDTVRLDHVHVPLLVDNIELLVLAGEVELLLGEVTRNDIVCTKLLAEGTH